jgi:hypothetical protein
VTASALPDASGLRMAARFMQDAGDVFHGYSAGINGAAAVPGWEDSAADAFRRGAGRLADDIQVGQDACYEAAQALKNLAAVVESVEHEHATLVAKRQELTKGGVTHEVRHLLEVSRVDASISSIEHRVASEAQWASQYIDQLTKKATLAREEAHRNGFWPQLGEAFVSSAKEAYHFGTGMVEGAATAVAGVVLLAWKVNPMRLEFDPLGYARDVTGLATGMARFGEDLWDHPGSTLYKSFDIEDLKHDPGRWVGGQLPFAALAIVSGGAGLAGRAAAGASALDGFGEVTAVRVLRFDTRQAARYEHGLDGPLARAANQHFYKTRIPSSPRPPATGWKITEFSDGTWRFDHTEPSDTPGYNKLYTRYVDSEGRSLIHYSDIVEPDGSWTRKYMVSGGK